MHVEIVQGDLLDQPVEVIVNAWNRNIIPWWLLLPQGVSGAIKRRAGVQPFRELAKLGVLPLGQAALTSAGRLPLRGIIHVAGINLLWRASEFSIRQSVRNAMKLVNEHRFNSVAFPVIGSGSGSFSEAAALKLMRDELTQIESDAKVIIVEFRRRRSSRRHFRNISTSNSGGGSIRREPRVNTNFHELNSNLTEATTITTIIRANSC